MALIHLQEPALPPGQGFALFALGFRPFYLLAALFAGLAVPVWALVFSNVLSLPMPGILWHAHEMIFGFACAVIIGFLFTAGRNWTGLPTPTGKPLAALAALWLVGRVGMAFDSGIIASIFDMLFLPLAATALARVLIKAKSQRNYFVPVMLSVLSLANLLFHLARFGVLMIDPLRPLLFALSLIVLLETVIGGRVIPMFTAAALRGVRQWQHTWLNHAAIVATLIALLLWVTEVGIVLAPVAIIAATLQLIRCIGWNPWATRRTPLLWILHLGHLWIPLGLLLLAAAAMGWLPRSAGVHAFSIGATGGLIIGMITRTALGHTGRKLIAGPVEMTAYALVQLAAVVRVLTLLALPAAVFGGIYVAAGLWSIAFLAFFLRYQPWLMRARPDGQPG